MSVALKTCACRSMIGMPGPMQGPGGGSGTLHADAKGDAMRQVRKSRRRTNSIRSFATTGCKCYRATTPQFSLAISALPPGKASTSTRQTFRPMILAT